jgi:hypothetical protein
MLGAASCAKACLNPVARTFNTSHFAGLFVGPAAQLLCAEIDPSAIGDQLSALAVTLANSPFFLKSLVCSDDARQVATWP